MKIALSFIVFFSLVSCNEEKPYILHVTRLQEQFSKSVQQTDSLEVIMVGGALFNDVSKVALDFVSHKKVDIQDARQMIVKHAESLKKLINEDQQVRPYLHNYPITAKNIDLKIIFEDENYRSYKFPYLESAYLSGNEEYIWYFIIKENGVLEIIHKESYDEALKIVSSTEQI